MLFVCGVVSAEDLTIEIKDYASMPVTGSVDGAGNSAGLLARINFLREEPGGGRRRLFVNDLNGPLYILEKATKKSIVYLDFNGVAGNSGIFHRLAIDGGLASGFISFEFDPDYGRNGKFYTIHLEDPSIAASKLPDNRNFPGLKASGYTATPSIRTHGKTEREAVLIEWTDTNTSNVTFEGTAREIMRLEYTGRIHPMGDLVFNPTARRGDAEWRVMYLSTGDGGNGEQKSDVRANPQRLDMLVGKVLRIVPDLSVHTGRSTVSENGCYRIPDDNPFASVEGARKEVWAYGLRNPHRLTWDVDPSDRRNNHLISLVVGLKAWESVDLIQKGANYGYSLREGPEQLLADNTMAPIPADDTIPILVDGMRTLGRVRPRYPVLAYAHTSEGGVDAIANGFVYRGKLIPALRRKFLFGDITGGRLWWADMAEMIAADGRDPKSMARMHEVKIAWKGQVHPRMAPINEVAYHERGGKAEHLPGAGRVRGGRSDIRLGMDAAGELYIMSKSDGVIRAVVGAKVP
ncbi:MAG TPA: PQQ-dependent sugar dehydrogenase [Tepidisphaeraceae bacterium]|nr:PQQ-dependent sugar dehydrogenase [Tepidisphaeraceae bacterium]